MSATEHDQWVVQIIEDATEKVVWQSKPTYRRRAEKIEDGSGINLDWEHYSTRIVGTQDAVEVEGQ
jgi:hypothetical protein